MAEVDNRDKIDKQASELFSVLADAFPVCCLSDEFHYFPQAVRDDRDWSRWDDFSAEAVEDASQKLMKIESAAEELSSEADGPDVAADLDLIRRVSLIVREQLVLAKTHREQPTFHLTVACMGLAEALESGEPGAFEMRAAGLPAFLHRAGAVTEEMPVLFRDLGLGMTGDVRQWFAALEGRRGGMGPALEALAFFEEKVKGARTRDEFRPAPELLDRVVRDHMGFGAGVAEIIEELEEEIARREGVLSRLASEMGAGSWKEALDQLEPPELPDGGLVELYSRAVAELEEHCIEAGIADPKLASANPVRVEPVPSYLSAIRSAAAYSMPPGRPPSGGVFFILSSGMSRGLARGLPRDHRILASHETWPGHHLLDACRWSLDNPVRRPVEFPLFYEGWACFAEELLELTGLWKAPADHLLLEKRHLLRAVRGLAELSMQAGAMSLEGAAHRLCDAGFDRQGAAALAAKYALKPGYQSCYALGLRRFEALYKKAGAGPGSFARKVLSGGEIGFSHLEKSLGT